MTAKFYIYRNLHKNTFSVKHRGKVIAHLDELYAHKVSFKVYEAGRQKVLRTKQKNVHAYVVCDNYTKAIDTDAFRNIYKDAFNTLVRYNPYHGDSFIDVNTGNPVHESKNVKLKDGKIWI
jgi:hypothetical protein